MDPDMGIQQKRVDDDFICKPPPQRHDIRRPGEHRNRGSGWLDPQKTWPEKHRFHLRRYTWDVPGS